MFKVMAGIESEYAFASEGHAGKGHSREKALSSFFEAARRKWKYLPDMEGKGIFLGNASYLYLDAGLHVELSTPECLNPYDVVKYKLAGERIIEQTAAELIRAYPDIKEALFFKCNVDYNEESASTWGCHESYMYRTDFTTLSAQLLPHLVSRIIYTGAGGWHPFSMGAEFLISPRAAHLDYVQSSNSTSNRGIIHLKNEPWAKKGYKRLHLICGESLCSETASFLKIGTTMLIITLIEAGFYPGDAAGLSNPLASLNLFNRDTDCDKPVPTLSGNYLTAVQIQRLYLQAAEKNIHKPFMPVWAEHLCRKWREVLDKIENRDFDSLALMLDWPMKRQLFRKYMKKKGLNWYKVSRLNEIVKRYGNNETAKKQKQKNNPQRQKLNFLKDLLIAGAKNISINKLNEFLAFRAELFEIDWRFSQIGENSIFAALDRSGSLKHHVTGIDNIERAVKNPPLQGRARIRGNCIKEFAKQNDGFRCHWDRIFDYNRNRMMDLSDPYEFTRRWGTIKQNSCDESNLLAIQNLAARLRLNRR